MRLLICLVLLALAPHPAFADVPTYTPQFLGAASHINAMNESGDVVGWVTSGAMRAFVVGPGRPYRLLPLPEGMLSSVANDVNEGGVIVGAVGPSTNVAYYLGGRAAKWTPDGSGGYTVTLLGQLPAHVASEATALNNLGDIVGFSFNGMFRHPVLFAGSGPIDLSATGFFDPSDVNDDRIVVDHSNTARRLDLDTMNVEDLGLPPGNYRSTWIEAISASGVIVGSAILTTSTSCDRQAVRYGAAGWQVLSICGPNNSAYDVNALGDVIMQLNTAVWVDFTGSGAHRVEDLIFSTNGHWFVINAYGNALNDARQIAVMAQNATTGESGAVLLTPTASTAVSETDATSAAVRLSLEPNPFRGATTLRIVLPRQSRAKLSLHDMSGRRITVLADRVFPAGATLLRWDGRDESSREIPAGLYFAQLSTDAGSRRWKVVRLR